MRVTTYPIRYPDAFQSFRQNGPYPMQFMQAPSFNHQLQIEYGGQPALQGLSAVRGPFMFPVRQEIIYPVGRGNQPAYPLTHSVPGPYQQKYIGLMGQSMQPSFDSQFAPVMQPQMPSATYSFYTRK